MMRYVKRILGFALVLAVLMTAAALAASPEDVVLVTVNGCISGNDYILLLLKPGTNTASIGDSDILFADQITAGGSSLEIAVVYPNFQACDIVAGGKFSNSSSSPVRVGTYKAARLPNQLKAIEEDAFANTRFTHVYLGNGVTAIGARAFANCGKLAYIYIPESVSSISGDAFSGDSNLVIGCASGSVAHTFAMNKGIRFILVGTT